MINSSNTRINDIYLSILLYNNNYTKHLTRCVCVIQSGTKFDRNKIAKVDLLIDILFPIR